MLRPEQMSKVSVTGSKGVMPEVIETVHDLRLLHVTEYDGSWEDSNRGLAYRNQRGFGQARHGSLATVHSDVSEEDAGPTRVVTDEAIEEQLDEVRTAVNELDDRRDDIRDELNELRLDHAGFLLAAEEKLAIDAQKRKRRFRSRRRRTPSSPRAGFRRSATTRSAGTLETVGEPSPSTDSRAPSTLVRGTRSLTKKSSARAATAANPSAVPSTLLSRRARANRRRPSLTAVSSRWVTTRRRLFRTIRAVSGRSKISSRSSTARSTASSTRHLLFLTFPTFFGFMIGDFGYGVIYRLGFFLYSKFEDGALKSMGGVTLAAGLFTTLFGVLYGEFFGLHQLGEIVWGGSPPMHKGLQPTYSGYALAWLTMSLLAGTVHLAAGWIVDFVENLNHSLGTRSPRAGPGC